MAFSEVTETIELVGPDAGGALSGTASNAITAGQLVKLDGTDSFTPADTAGEAAIGVATQTVASGETVHVASIGSVVRFTAAGAVSAQDKLAADPTTNNGEVNTANTTGDFVVGVALDGGAGAQGDAFVGIVTLAGEVN